MHQVVERIKELTKDLNLSPSTRKTIDEICDELDRQHDEEIQHMARIYEESNYDEDKLIELEK